MLKFCAKIIIQFEIYKKTDNPFLNYPFHQFMFLTYRFLYEEPPPL